MSAARKKSEVGERLPYLLAKMKAPRVLERLAQTAERARAEEWPYEQFLEALLEAEVFARDASGARQRIRHASFPARKTLEDFDWTAQPAFSYSHEWEDGDCVVWDNTCALHRVVPYAADSGRKMHRTAIAGVEEIA